MKFAACCCRCCCWRSAWANVATFVSACCTFWSNKTPKKWSPFMARLAPPSSWQPDEWTERQTNACYFWPGSGTCPGCLPACPAGWLAACVSMALGRCCQHTQTHTHSQRKLCCGMQHTLWHWHWENCGSRHSQAAPVSQLARPAASSGCCSCCPSSRWCCIFGVPSAKCRSHAAYKQRATDCAFCCTIWHRMIHAGVVNALTGSLATGCCNRY